MKDIQKDVGGTKAPAAGAPAGKDAAPKSQEDKEAEDLEKALRGGK